MIPYLLAIVGGYLIGDATKEKQLFSKGGKVAKHTHTKIDLHIDRRLYGENYKEKYEVAKFNSKGDALISASALNEKSPDNYNYIVSDANGKFSNGGNVDEIKYQLFDNNVMLYASIDMNGMIKWNDSPDLGYQYSKKEAQIVKTELENKGYDNISIVEYDKNWWKK
jgi:hypothetical protein